MSFLLTLLSTFTILFATNGDKDSNSAASGYEKIIASSTYSFVTGTSTLSKVYCAKDGYGIKLGTTSAVGEVTLLFDTTYHITAATVYACAYDGKDSASAGIRVMGQSIAWKAPRRHIQAYPIHVNVRTNSLNIATLRASYGRAYIEKVVLEVEDEYSYRAKLMLSSSYKNFPDMAFDAQQPATDEEAFSVQTKDVVSPTLTLSVTQHSRAFSVSPTTLPSEGGEFTIAYTYSGLGSLKDTLIVSAQGGNGRTVTRRMPVSVSVYQYTPKPVDSTGMVISPVPTPEYYQPIENQRDSALKSILGRIINCGVRYRYGSGSNHTWDAFYSTDRDTLTNAILDMYSNEQRFFRPEQPANSVVGLDIEHMFPKSWWGGTDNKAYRDLYHLVPGDYSANRSKSNHAPGTPTDSSFYNGSFVTGADEVHGLARVFCPADEYKGDFARAYFYIACCYGDSLRWLTTDDAGKAMTNQHWQEFRPWLRDLLLEWHRMDPVSEKEVTRQVAVNHIQGNRNPFIDYPELVEYIWGEHQGEAVHIGDLTPTFQVQNSPTDYFTLSPAEGTRKTLRRGQVVLQVGDDYFSVMGTPLP